MSNNIQMAGSPAARWNRLMSREVAYVDGDGRLHRSAGSGFINPCSRGGPLSREVSMIRSGNNPHPHSLGEAIQIADQRSGKSNPSQLRPRPKSDP